MKRSGTVIAACVLALVALAACSGTPAGVDKDLVDDWPAFATAVTPTPVAATCYTASYTETWTGGFDDKTVPCRQSHQTETTFVGTFSGALTARTSPPLANSTDLAPAYQDCAQHTEDYLGGPWQSAYAWLALTLPGGAAWRGGARWYRCELIMLTRTLDETTTAATASAKDGLRGSRPIARTCTLVVIDGSGSLKSEDGVDCAKPHNAEFAGLYTISASTYPTGTKLHDLSSAACQKVYTSFLGISPSKSHYFGWTWQYISEEEWNLGVRTGVCQVIGFSHGSVNSVRFTGSVRGFGDRRPTGWTG